MGTIKRLMLTSVAVAAACGGTPASAVITAFAGSSLVSDGVAFTNADAFTNIVTPATTVSHTAVSSTIHGTYTAAQIGKTYTVAAVTVSHAAVVTTNPDGTTTKAAYVTTTTPAYTYKVTAAGASGTGTATKTVGSYIATTAPKITTVKLTANAGTLSNVSNVATGPYAGSTKVAFSFLNNALAPYVTNKAAYFTLSATSDTSATSTTIPGFGTILTQPLLTGTFAFVSATNFSIRGTQIHIGDSFLSGSFSGTSLAALLGSSTASVEASSLAGATVTFNNSEFLDFTNPLRPITETDATFNVNSVATGVNKTYADSSLKTFTGALSTQFASDPAPTVLIVPEPEVWALLLAGFGMVGVQARRRRIGATVAS